MKRLFCLLLSLMLLLCGCGGAAAPGGTTATTAPEETEPPISPYAQAAMDTNTLHYYFFTADGQTASTGNRQTMCGDACLIFFPNGENMLIDTSTLTIYPVFKAWLEEKGVHRIDHLVMTHPANDHIGGANAGLIFDFKIGMLYHNHGRNDLLFTALEKDIPFTGLRQGDQVTIGEGDRQTTVKVMWPTKDYLTTVSGTAGTQSQSLVLRLDFGEHSSLFAGDIYKTYEGSFDSQEKKKVYHIKDKVGAEEQMAAMYENNELDVDLLKLANHGNPSTSNGHALFKATTPELCVATGFYPLESGYIEAYEKRGFKGKTLFDRKHGFIHVTASADGKMETETSRTDYKDPFGWLWNTEVGG